MAALRQSREEIVDKMNLYKESKIEEIMEKCGRIAYNKGRQLTPLHFSNFDTLHYHEHHFLRNFLQTKLISDNNNNKGNNQTNDSSTNSESEPNNKLKLQYSDVPTGVLLKDDPKRTNKIEKYIIDVGAGVGGPARYIAHMAQGSCHVTAFEFLPQLVRCGQFLNRLQLLHNYVTYVCGDITTVDISKAGLAGMHDGLVSQLCFLHIKDKQVLFSQCAKTLRKGAFFYIEDYFLKQFKEVAGNKVVISEREAAILEDDLSIPDAAMSTKEAYQNVLFENSLIVDDWIDMSDQWADFIWKRYQTFLTNKQNVPQAERFNTEIEHFYKQVSKIFYTINGSSKTLIERYPLVAQRLEEDQFDFSVPQSTGGAIIIGHKE